MNRGWSREERGSIDEQRRGHIAVCVGAVVGGVAARESSGMERELSLASNFRYWKNLVSSPLSRFLRLFQECVSEA